MLSEYGGISRLMFVRLWYWKIRKCSFEKKIYLKFNTVTNDGE
jgi:hypothetical protein